MYEKAKGASLPVISVTRPQFSINNEGNGKRNETKRLRKTERKKQSPNYCEALICRGIMYRPIYHALIPQSYHQFRPMRRSPLDFHHSLKGAFSSLSNI